MAFAIQITEVGPAEFPLIQTLRDTIFSEFGHRSQSSIASQLDDQKDLLLLMAHLEGNPVGFSAGYRRTGAMFYLNYIGVLSDYRRQGLGKAMLQRQIDFAKACNYRRIEFNTFNHFPSMIRLGLSAGFRPIGLIQDEGSNWDLAILFAKNLEEQLPPGAELRDIDANSRELICPADDPANLRRALDAGFQFHGMLHQPGKHSPSMVLHRIQK
jgi:GNAT superfamily N-acetyltransferase